MSTSIDVATSAVTSQLAGALSSTTDTEPRVVQGAGYRLARGPDGAYAD